MIDDLDTFVMSLIPVSESESESQSESPLMDQWTRDIEQVIDAATATPIGPADNLQRVKSKVTVIRRLLGASSR